MAEYKDNLLGEANSFLEVLEQVSEKAQETVNKRIEHEITRILNGYGG